MENIRVMPVNLCHTDSVSTMFGDENNFNLGSTVNGEGITYVNVENSVVIIQNPNSEILYKSCVKK